MSALLDEKALRKPEFTPGVRLKLDDGQEWEFPPITYRLFPRFVDEDNVKFLSKFTDGKGIDHIIDEDDNTDPDISLQNRIVFLGKLLRSNYNLTLSDLERLLGMNRRDPVSAAIWEPIDRMLAGLPPETDSPKPSANGSDTP